MCLFSHVWLIATLWTIAHPDSYVHGIFQTRVLEWITISFSREFFQPRGQSDVSCIAGGFFTIEPSGKLHGVSESKESACTVGDLGSIPGLERFPREENVNPLQYACLGEFHGQRSLVGYSPWGLKESDMTDQVKLSLWGLLDGTSGKEPACQCRRHKRHGFNPWVRKIPGRRKQNTATLFFPGKFHGERNLVGYSSWDHKEPDRTENII